MLFCFCTLFFPIEDRLSKLSLDRDRRRARAVGKGRRLAGAGANERCRAHPMKDVVDGIAGESSLSR